ncbi:hypothetical protein [Peterkaempfera griseoplana]|uniref:hypothetical protein n=1 Tax=Peterkaempfera griseoplana TaxID=66896 RepID=UPI000B2D5AFB
MTAGLPRSADPDPAVRRAAYEASEADRATQIAATFPRVAEPIACIVEMEGESYFSRTRQRDSKSLFKVLPALGRNVQCLRPITPAAPDPCKKTDIERAAAALRDALRQAGRLVGRAARHLTSTLTPAATGCGTQSGECAPR